MTAPLHPRGTLLGATLRAAFLWLVPLIALVCLAIYMGTAARLENETRLKLTARIEDSAREHTVWFDLIKSKHRQLSGEYLQRYRHLRDNPDLMTEAAKDFTSVFDRDGEGRHIVKPTLFRPETPIGLKAQWHDMSGAIDRLPALDDEIKIRHLLGLQLCWEHGQGFVRSLDAAHTTPALDLYFQTPEGSLLICWPGVLWNPFASPGFKFPGHPYFDYGLPAFNPGRKTVWTPVLFDEVAKVWMISCITPVDLDGRHLGHFGTDVEITEILREITRDALPGSTPILVDSDGRLLAHPRLMDAVKHPGGFRLDRDAPPDLRRIHALAVTLNKPGVVLDKDGDALIASAPIIDGQWRIIAVYPRAHFTAEARQSALLICGFATLLLGALTVLLFAVLKRHITIPVKRLLDDIRHAESPRRDDAAPLPIAMNNELGSLAIAFDAMARRVRETHEGLERTVAERTRQLAAARDAAEAANRAKSAFLANMSHELRTPLNAILGFAQLLGHETDDDDPRAESIRIIRKSGEHLLTLINDVLDLSKIEARRVTLEPVSFDLGDFLDDLILMFHERAHEKGLKLFVHQTSSFPRFIHADREKLRRCLINLVGNALKFTQAGSVSLKLTLLSAPAEANRCRIHFEVADTGPGIPDADLDRIFNPFERLSSHSAVEGTGLGLAITREYVRLMGGELKVRSTLGRGTVFDFSIVCDYVSEQEIRGLPVENASEIVAIEGARDCPILIVEDHAENRLLLRRTLAPFGFPILEAADGRSGLEIASETPPALVLLDRRMPEMDGVETAKAMRALPGGESLRIVAVTAQAFEDERREMMEAGCDAFIRKPFRDAELLETIARLLPIKLIRPDRAPPTATPAANEDSETAGSLATLSDADLAALEVAVLAADGEAAGAVLDRHSDLSHRLSPLLDAFRFDRLADLLHAARARKDAPPPGKN